MGTSARREAVAAAIAAANAALAAAKPGDHLGDLTWWDLRSGWTAPAPGVRAAWAAAGLDPDADLPAVPGADTAFVRSVSRAARAATRHDCRIEECADSADGARRVAVVQMVAGSADVTGTTVGLVRQDPKGAITVEQSDAHGLAIGIVAGVAGFEGAYTVSDLRDAMKAVFDRWAATPCRQAPPHIVYWVPAPGAAVLRQVRDAVAAAGAGRVHVSPMMRNAESIEAAGAAATDGLEARLADFAAQVEAWKATPPGRAATVERRIAEAEALRATGNLYRSILGAAAASVDARIDALQASMRQALGCLDAAAEE